MWCRRSEAHSLTIFLSYSKSCLMCDLLKDIEIAQIYMFQSIEREKVCWDLGNTTQVYEIK